MRLSLSVFRAESRNHSESLVPIYQDTQCHVPRAMGLGFSPPPVWSLKSQKLALLCQSSPKHFRVSIKLKKAAPEMSKGAH